MVEAYIRGVELSDGGYKETQRKGKVNNRNGGGGGGGVIE